jgi:hypothetical protein
MGGMELGRGVVGREVKKMEEGGGARFYSDTLVSNTHSIFFFTVCCPFIVRHLNVIMCLS